MDNAAVREFTGVHNMIRGLVRLLEAALSEAKPGDAKQMKVLGAFGQFAVAGTRFHHGAEDDWYWPAVVRNGADPSLLGPLVEEHHKIDPLLDEMERAFGGLNGPTDSGAIESVRAVTDRFRDELLHHLDTEEPVFFPLLAQYMPDDESERLAADLAKKAPRKGLSWLMGGVEYGMTEEQFRRVPGHLPEADPVGPTAPVAEVRKDCAVLGVDPATPSERAIG